jgi:hypothetical protein
MIDIRKLRTKYNTNLVYYKNDLIILFLLLTVIICSFVFSVSGNSSYIPIFGGIRIPLTCILKAATGYNCPTCGMTRSFISIAHGDFYGALKYNLGGVLAFALCIQEIIFRFIKIITDSRSFLLKYIRLFMKFQVVLLAVLLFVNWVLFYNV